MRKSKAWYILWPNTVYAEGPLRWFDHPVSERKVRKAVRDREGLSRLPNGFKLWPTDD